VVFVLIDGARPDVFASLLARGDLPNLARLVVEPGGFTTGTTVFPSTTGVGYLPFLLGRYPGHAGIPGIRWLDRSAAAGNARSVWRAARSYCGPQGSWLNRDITASPTIFEIVPDSLAICTPVTRGLGRRSHLIPVARAVLGSAAHYLGTYAALDRAVAQAWIAAATLDWRFLFVVFPGIDGITHLNDPFHPAVSAAYRAVDGALGTFATKLTANGRDLPVFVVAADHGASTVTQHADVALALESWGMPTLRHPMHLWRSGARAAVMISGNACAHVYFEPRSGRARPLTYEELPADILARLLELPAIRVAACRAADGGVIVMHRDQRARIAEDPAGIRYEPLHGDPLGLGNTTALFDDRELLAITRTGPLPDAPRQLLQVLRTERAGDIVLGAAHGSDLRGPWELPEHRAGHGSLIPEHMLVPVATSIPIPRVPIRTVDLMPTMLEWLGADVPAGLDGVPFTRLAARVTDGRTG
jgi:hypothetical protein